MRRLNLRWRASSGIRALGRDRSDLLAEWGTRLAMASVLAFAMAYIPYHLIDGSGARRAERLRSQRDAATHAIERLSQENARYRREIDALRTDPLAIEDLARDELGMVRPGEVVVRVVPTGESR